MVTIPTLKARNPETMPAYSEMKPRVLYVEAGTVFLELYYGRVWSCDAYGRVKRVDPLPSISMPPKERQVLYGFLLDMGSRRELIKPPKRWKWDHTALAGQGRVFEAGHRRAVPSPQMAPEDWLLLEGGEDG